MFLGQFTPSMLFPKDLHSAGTLLIFSFAKRIFTEQNRLSTVTLKIENKKCHNMDVLLHKSLLVPIFARIWKIISKTVYARKFRCEIFLLFNA